MHSERTGAGEGRLLVDIEKSMGATFATVWSLVKSELLEMSEV
jgi:hypothetical protein